MEGNIRLYEFTAEVLPFMLTTDTVTKVDDGIPPGAEFVGSGYDYQRGIHYIYMEHESFDHVHEGERLEPHEITVTDVTDEVDA